MPRELSRELTNRFFYVRESSRKTPSMRRGFSFNTICVNKLGKKDIPGSFYIIMLDQLFCA